MPETLSKTIGDKAHKAYIRRLNKLAGAGYDTPEKLLERPFKVTDTIKRLAPGNDGEARQERRYYIAAVFYVLPEAYRQKNNPYYMLARQSRPIDLVSGLPWDNNKERYLANN